MPQKIEGAAMFDDLIPENKKHEANSPEISKDNMFYDLIPKEQGTIQNTTVQTAKILETETLVEVTLFLIALALFIAICLWLKKLNIIKFISQNFLRGKSKRIQYLIISLILFYTGTYFLFDSLYPDTHTRMLGSRIPKSNYAEKFSLGSTLLLCAALLLFKAFKLRN